MSIKASTLTGAGFSAGSVNASDGSTAYTKAVGGLSVTATLSTQGSSAAGYSGQLVVNINGDVSGTDVASFNSLLVTLGLADGKTPQADALSTANGAVSYRRSF
jgi:hypothetical protein